MKQKMFSSFLAICCVLGGFVLASADTYYSTVLGNPPYVSAQLLDYLEDRNFEAIVGLAENGTAYTSPDNPDDIWGQSVNDKTVGDGSDEYVPFSFVFPRFLTIEEAKLTLTLTPQDSLVRTDYLWFADDRIDLGDNWASGGYGNDQFRSLAVGTRYILDFDLTNIEYTFDISNSNSGHIMANLSKYLLDRNLDVVFGDDALVHSAVLKVTGTTPEPSTFLLLGFGLVGLAGIRRKLSRK